MFFPCGQGNVQYPPLAALRPAPRAMVAGAESKTPGQTQARQHRMVNGTGASTVRRAHRAARTSVRIGRAIAGLPRVHALALLAALVSVVPAGAAANSGAGHPTRQPSGSSSICDRLAARWRGLPANVIAAGLRPGSSPIPGGVDSTRQHDSGPALVLADCAAVERLRRLRCGTAVEQHVRGRDASARNAAFHGAGHRRFRCLPDAAVRSGRTSRGGARGAPAVRFACAVWPGWTHRYARDGAG